MSAYVPIVDSILDVRELTVSSAGYTDSFPRLLRPTARALRDRIEPVLALMACKGGAAQRRACWRMVKSNGWSAARNCSCSMSRPKAFSLRSWSRLKT